VQQATFRLAGGNAYAAATANADARMRLWCNDHCDLLDVRGTDAGDVLAAVDDDVGVRERVAEGDATLAVTDACLRAQGDGVEDTLAAHGCLLVPPLTYVDGEKHLRVLALTPDALTGVYHDLRADYDVTVADKQTVSAPQSAAPREGAPDLTARQAAVLRAAVESGYYERPRETTTADLADRFGLARSTLEEHLRRAERKVTTAFVAAP
jgi:predicted DNA binding protein